MVLELLGRGLELFGLVREKIQVDGVVRSRRKIHALVVDTGVKRRINQRVEHGVFELDPVSVLGFHIESAGELPAIREPQFGRK